MHTTSNGPPVLDRGARSPTRHTLTIHTHYQTIKQLGMRPQCSRCKHAAQRLGSDTSSEGSRPLRTEKQEQRIVIRIPPREYGTTESKPHRLSRFVKNGSQCSQYSRTRNSRQSWHHTMYVTAMQHCHTPDRYTRAVDSNRTVQTFNQKHARLAVKTP
jgi:hypothetical protein